ncbi:MAG: hypothetical protein ACXWLW_11485, partial [Rhizomicrobium sp.]
GIGQPCDGGLASRRRNGYEPPARELTPLWRGISRRIVRIEQTRLLIAAGFSFGVVSRDP